MLCAQCTLIYDVVAKYYYNRLMDERNKVKWNQIPKVGQK